MFKGLLEKMGLGKTAKEPGQKASAAPSSKWIDKVEAAASFSSIKASGRVFVDWKKGEPSCVVTFDELDPESSGAKVVFEAGALVACQGEGAKSPIRVRCSSRSLESIECCGLAGGNIEGVDAEIFKAKMQDGAKLSIGGKAIAAVLAVEGSGKMHADGLLAHTVEAKMLGCGLLEAKAESVAKAIIGGGGEVMIFGDPSVSSIERVGDGRAKIGSKIASGELFDDTGIFGQLPIPKK